VGREILTVKAFDALSAHKSGKFKAEVNVFESPSPGMSSASYLIQARDDSTLFSATVFPEPVSRMARRVPSLFLFIHPFKVRWVHS